MTQKEEIFLFRNTGGFDLLGSGRTKIETEEQLAAATRVCQELKLDGLVIVGGDDSNTNAAVLAEYLLAKGCKTRVIGLPKTIDGDLQAEHVPISFGFDTACKTYSELIGNIAKDAVSSLKYTHFIKLMGRSASHIALECALSTHPNLTLIGEEEKGLSQVVDEIVSVIERRSKKGKEYGAILIPEGLIEFIPEMKRLISALNQIAEKDERVILKLEKEDKEVFETLPQEIQKQLLLDRDPHGNVLLSQVDTQVLLIDLVAKRLKERGFMGKFSPQAHFLGYEGRAAYPSNFDATYCLALGMAAVFAIRDGLTGVLCGIPNLKEKVDLWQIWAVPLVSLMALEKRKGKEKPVIAKTVVDLKGKAFARFSRDRKRWEEEDAYLSPGPIQFFGDKDLCDAPPLLLTS